LQRLLIYIAWITGSLFYSGQLHANSALPSTPSELTIRSSSFQGSSVVLPFIQKADQHAKGSFAAIEGLEITEEEDRLEEAKNQVLCINQLDLKCNSKASEMPNEMARCDQFCIRLKRYKPHAPILIDYQVFRI